VKRRVWTWPIFVAGALLILGGAAAASAMVLRAEREARYQGSLRLALWRIDQRCAELLARESARPHGVYAPFLFLETEAYTRMMQQIAADEIRVRSPLLANPGPYILIHFQIDATGRFSSPQVPRGNAYECSVPGLLPEDRYRENAALLARVAREIDPAAVGLELARPEPGAQAGAQASKRWVAAQNAKQAAQQEDRAGPRDVAVGSFRGLWVDEHLYFLREVRVGEERYRQGFLVDWPSLRAVLLEDIEDLFIGASIEPCADDGPRADQRLFTIPAVLRADAGGAIDPGWTPAHTLLALFWPLVLIALGATAAAVRGSLRFGESQRRFASLVTHELRSPLTTFRLYADLLAEGLVTDDAKRADYHRTLQRESDQMARLVENVIAHARIEEGRAKLHPEPVRLGDLVDRLKGSLERSVARSGCTVAIRDAQAGTRDATVDVDVDAVGQILLNLVENACKYGTTADCRAIGVELGADAMEARVAVRDHGPGVPAALARRIFRPFERGGHEDGAAGSPDGEAHPIRGLGLGLALAQGLARDLGGRLTLEPPPDGGARFVLTLPRR